MGPKVFFGVKIGSKMGFLMIGYGPSFNFYEKNSKIQRNGSPKVVDNIEHEIIRVQDDIMKKDKRDEMVYMRWL